MTNMKRPSMMDYPFPRSASKAEKYRQLLRVAGQEDVLGILIDAGPDSMASALALKRLFWRKVRRSVIYHMNTIRQAESLAFTKLLKLDQQRVSDTKQTNVTKWAIVGSQPHHNKDFMNYQFDIIIDHHPLECETKGRFVDIQEAYGANSTIMTEYIRAAKIRPSPKLATALFYGIKKRTDNFVRKSLSNDINALRYLHQFANMNIIKKIEATNITKKALAIYRVAMERLTFFNDIAFTHLGNIGNPDILATIADFFMKLAEVTLSVVSGVYHKRLIVVFRNASFRRDAGKLAQKVFGGLDGFAGGQKGAARAEVPLNRVPDEMRKQPGLGTYVLKKIQEVS